MTKKQITLGLILVIILNIFDLFATLFWIDQGIATEGNPLLAWCLDRSIWLFSFVKMSIVAMYTFVTWKYQELKLAQIGIIISTASYFALFIYHCFIAIQFLRLNYVFV